MFCTQCANTKQEIVLENSKLNKVIYTFMVHAKILQIWQVKHVCHNLQLTLGTSLIEEGLKKLSAMYLRPAPVRVFPPL